ncbi:hypothetical protein Tco_0663540 [Tanacetum coccineum]
MPSHRGPESCEEQGYKMVEIPLGRGVMIVSKPRPPTVRHGIRPLLTDTRPRYENEGDPPDDVSPITHWRSKNMAGRTQRRNYQNVG